MRFEQFVGNAQAKTLIAAAVDSGRFPHALLIEGPAGSGRKTLAHLFAKAAVCTAGDKPCGMCAQCLKAETGHPDITWLRGDGTPKSLSVAVIRELREACGIVPNEADHKVAVISDADCMNVQAQNALLKILEEPPSYMLFVLTAESRTQFLPTVQSRCVTVSLNGVSEAEALATLSQRLPDHSEDDLLMRARMYGGCIGAVLDSVGDDAFARTAALIGDIAVGITCGGELSLMKATAPLEKDKSLTDAVLRGLQLVLRDALALSAGLTATVSVAPDAARTLVRGMTQKQILACVQAVEELQTARKRNMNQTLLITLLCARLRAAAGR